MAIKPLTLNELEITTGGVARPVSDAAAADRPVSSLTITALDSNTGDMYVGDSSVVAGTGTPLPPGAVAVLTGDEIRGITEEFYLSDVYINSGTAGNKVRLLAFQRRP